MGFAGGYWLLWEDEPVDLAHTRFFKFRDGVVLDARTGEPRGTFVETADGIDATFDEEHGEREVVKIRMHVRLETHDLGFTQVTPPFDPAADGFALTFSSVRYEQYLATRPANDHETDEQEDARRDWEVERFGIVPMFGFAYPDCPEVREMGAANEREYQARLRREGIATVPEATPASM